MDEFDRLMATPRLCRVCGKKCQGVRCGKCRSPVGRLLRIVGGAGNKGIDEQTIGKHYQVESVMRELERDGEIHETPKGWSLGLHPEQIALWDAWEKRKESAK